MGPPQARQRLSQQAARQQVAKSKWLQGIDHHQIEIPMQSPMLEPVVEDDQLGLEFLDGRAGRGYAIGIL
jgi:hypothetical protein